MENNIVYETTQQNNKVFSDHEYYEYVFEADRRLRNALLHHSSSLTL